VLLRPLEQDEVYSGDRYQVLKARSLCTFSSNIRLLWSLESPLACVFVPLFPRGQELFTKYQVPRNLGRSWLENDQLLFLLDGLDEVIQVHRSACIQAINAYRQEHNLVPVVLCSRKAEYEAQSTLVTLSKAVVIQPLTSQQIDDYLTQAGQQLEAVRSLLREDQELQELARAPLMLTILALTYRGKAVDDLMTRMPPDMQRHHVFKTYVERMLQRRAASHYTPDQTERWLAWLAQQMAQHSQTEFYLERIQPGWLPKTWFDRLHPTIAAGLLGTLLFGVSGTLAALYAGFHHGDIVVFGMSSGVLGGLILELFCWSTGLLSSEIQPVEVITWSLDEMRKNIIKFLGGGCFLGCLGGFVVK
jgi:hypothetical protein